jgi:uncharacterized membrane protein
MRAVFALAFMLMAAPVQADLRICNLTPSRIGVALGYRDGQGWVTEGWWNLKPSGCETLLQGRLTSRYYYLHAMDYDRGGAWTGSATLCTQDRQFTIRGMEDCLVKGYDKRGFFEVDTQEQNSWTLQLVDPARPAMATTPNTNRSPTLTPPKR